MNRPRGGCMLRNEQQPRLELNLEDPLYHVTCVAASVHLNLDSDPIYGCTDEPPNLGARLDIIAYDSCPYICVATLCSCVAPLGLVFSEYCFSVCCIVVGVVLHNVLMSQAVQCTIVYHEECFTQAMVYPVSASLLSGFFFLIGLGSQLYPLVCPGTPSYNNCDFHLSQDKWKSCDQLSFSNNYSWMMERSEKMVMSRGSISGE